MDNANNNLSFAHEEPSQLVISISGKLDQNLLTSLWERALKLQSQRDPEFLIIDAKDITDCDSLGALLIFELKKRQLAANKKFDIRNSSEKLNKILVFLEKQKISKVQQKSQPNFVTKIGMKVVSALVNVRENIIFLGTIVHHVAQFFYSDRKVTTKIRWQDFWRVVYDVGPRALPIMVMIGFLVGLITSFQSATPLGRFGAQIYIIDLVGLGLVREMGPLITSVLLAGRTASSFAAEIGTMKINQEIDALTTMGIEQIKFLVIPRVLGALILTPILSMFFMLAALIGCLAVMLSLGYSLHFFVSELNNAISFTDFFSGLVKTFVFGAVIAGVGCLHGIKTGFGSSAVGNSTTQAVVSSLIMLVVIDGIFATVYYYLGI